MKRHYLANKTYCYRKEQSSQFNNPPQAPSYVRLREQMFHDRCCHIAIPRALGLLVLHSQESSRRTLGNTVRHVALVPFLQILDSKENNVCQKRDRCFIHHGLENGKSFRLPRSYYFPDLNKYVRKS